MMELLRRLFPLERGMWWKNVIWGLVYALCFWFPMPERLQIPRWVVNVLFLAVLVLWGVLLWRKKLLDGWEFLGWRALGLLAGGCVVAAVKLPEGFRTHAGPEVLWIAGGIGLAIHLFMELRKLAQDKL